MFLVQHQCDLLWALDSAVWIKCHSEHTNRINLPTCILLITIIGFCWCFFSNLYPFVLCFYSGNVQRAIPSWLDGVLPLWQWYTHQESECLSCAQWRQSREPEWVDVARQPHPGLGLNHETLPPAERESKQTSLFDQRFRTSYDHISPYTTHKHLDSINIKIVRHHPRHSLFPSQSSINTKKCHDI